jgi:EAL domain-containing protein (putative c-di-GMP-specific phosphodiesterase class I)
LLKTGGIAMQRAKELGRNTWQLYADLPGADVSDHVALAGALREALRGGDELQVHYQPQMDLRTGAVVGFEALTRWNHPRLGFVPPEQFIRIAETNGHIAALGYWVLAQACRQLKALSAEGYAHARMAVNVSVVQLRDLHFAERCLRIARECGIAPGRLELEVTESVLLHDRESVILHLTQLRAQGVTIAIDDFGTGFSSLSYLHNLPFDKVKIDRSFVRDMAVDADARAIVRGIIGLAHSLRHRCVAEGVETQAQRFALARLQCDYAQGYLFARAMPAAALLEWLCAGDRRAPPSPEPVAAPAPEQERPRPPPRAAHPLAVSSSAG